MIYTLERYDDVTDERVRVVDDSLIDQASQRTL